MKYYFVAQGQTYLTEHSQKYLWAPIDNIWHHKIMNDVKKGDVIIQYNGSIVGVGIAIADCYKSTRPNDGSFNKWSEQGYKVDVEQFHFITPVNKETIKNELLKNQPGLHAPLNINGGVNQGYLFSANVAMLNIILENALKIDSSSEQKAIVNKIIEVSNIMEKPTAVITSKGQIPNLDQNNIVKQSLSPLILYGPPGTGKTFKMQHEYIDKFAKEDRFITTFHQSFSYEEFVEGLKPVLAEKTAGDTSSNVKYEIQKGIFYKACEQAARLAGFASLAECVKSDNRAQKMDEAIKKNKIVLLCIDEINRANVSAVFGDLISLIEPSKRIGAKNEMVVSLPYSKEDFAVPANLMIVGTMNTADRSIQLLDSALRRRFRFEELLPDYEKIENATAKGILQKINARIRCLLDKDHQIGHSYFIEAKNDLDIFNAIKDCVIPLLEEYFYNDAQKIRQILNEKDNSETNFYITDTEAQDALEKMQNDYDDEKEFYMLNPELEIVNDDSLAQVFLSHIING